MKVGIAQEPRGSCRFAHKTVLDGLQTVNLVGRSLCEDNAGVGYDRPNASCEQSHHISKGELAPLVEKRM